MIRSFADNATHRLFEDGRGPGLRGLEGEAALMLLDALDAAPTVDPLRALRVAGLHAVRDSAPQRWAMTIDARWRLAFRLRSGEAQAVKIENIRTE